MSQRQKTTNGSTTVEDAPVDSPRAKLVLLYLRVREEATVRETAEDLDLGLTELFPVLEGLERADLVRRAGDGDAYTAASLTADSAARP